jgi:hypothetical protein
MNEQYELVEIFSLTKSTKKGPRFVQFVDAHLLVVDGQALSRGLCGSIALTAKIITLVTGAWSGIAILWQILFACPLKIGKICQSDVRSQVKF